MSEVRGYKRASGLRQLAGGVFGDRLKVEVVILSKVERSNGINNAAVKFNCFCDGVLSRWALDGKWEASIEAHTLAAMT